MSGVLDNVIKSVPNEYATAFMRGYKNCIDGISETLNDNVYKTESIDTRDVALKSVNIPKEKASYLNITSKRKFTGKRDYINDQIRNIEIGEAVKNLVWKQEHRLLLEVLKQGKIDKFEDKLDWASRHQIQFHIL